MHFILMLCYIFFISHICMNYVESMSYDDLNCVVDDTLPASSSDNYIDCQSQEMVAAGRDKCCKIEGSVGCCEPGGRWKKILAMSLGIGLTFITLAVIYIYLFWCKKDTIPCLGRCQDRIQKKYYQAEESLPCCASRVERRKQEQEIMVKSKDQPAFNLPDDEFCNSNYKEEWWSGQTIKNF